MRRKSLVISCIIMYILGITTYVIIQMIGGSKSDYNSEYTTNSGYSNNTINNINSTSITNETTSTTKKTTIRQSTKQTQKSGTYKLTHYGYNCKGCGGKTATGYDISKTIYYNDATYGKLRIVAMKDLQLYSVIKIKNYKLGGDIYAIVLDRGVGSGVIDLAVENESKASQLGIQNNVEIEIIRSGK